MIPLSHNQHTHGTDRLTSTGGLKLLALPFSPPLPGLKQPPQGGEAGGGVWPPLTPGGSLLGGAGCPPLLQAAPLLRPLPLALACGSGFLLTYIRIAEHSYIQRI